MAKFVVCFRYFFPYLLSRSVLWKYIYIYSQQLVNFLCLLCACKILLLTVLHPVHWLLPAYKNCTKAGLSICAGVLNIDAVYQAVCSLLHSHLQSLVRISSVDLCPQSSWSHITTPVADLTDTGTARHELSMVTGKSRGVMDSLKYVLRSSLCCILDGSPFHLQHALGPGHCRIVLKHWVVSI